MSSAKKKLVAFTSISAGPATADSLAFIRHLDAEPIIVTHKGNLEQLQKVVAPQDYQNAVVLTSFEPASAAATKFCTMLVKRQIHLDEWINITDDTTAFFLNSCRKIGLDFSFRRPYEQSRVKAICRTLLAKSKLSDTKFSVHGISDTDLPHGFLFPFVAKPLLGAGSLGVEIIRGTRQWKEYLRKTKALIKTSNLRIGPYSLDQTILAEEILGGQECQLDGIVEGGRVTFYALGMKTASYGLHGFRETSGILYRPMTLKDNRSHDSRLMKWGRQVLGALGFENGTFHMEAKVNGPDIHLLEVNPRPGGGANNQAIKLISGVDMNKECIRLWIGGTKQKYERPVHSSISFAVRYPSRAGFVYSVRKRGSLQSVLTKVRGRIEWIPLVDKGTRVDHRLREQYLGVLLAPDFCRRASEIESASQQLLTLIQRNALLTEKGTRRSK
jgi:hypothetical protein